MNMAVNPMMASGVNGIHQGMKELDSLAQEVAGFSGASPERGDQSSFDDLGDAAEVMVDLKTYERQVQASAKVVQTADEVIGFLLDIRA